MSALEQAPCNGRVTEGVALKGREEEMNAGDFLGMILDKHHGGYLPEEDEEIDGYSGEDEPIPRLSDGCEWNDDVDK